MTTSASSRTSIRRLAAAIGRPELVDDPRFRGAAARLEHGAEVNDLVGAWVAEQDAQLLERKNRQVDIEGKLTVCQGRLDECNRSLAAKSAAAQQPAAP